MPSPSALLIGAIAGTLVVGGAVTVVAATRGPGTSVSAQIVKVVDGDTIDVRYDGSSHRVRLLSIDTPEVVDPNKPEECLGREASEFLKERLPVGTDIRLEFDQERVDSYDRELAGVFLGESLVNAEIAARGLGVPLLVEPNDRFYLDVVAAHETAKSQQVGLFDPGVGCSIPAQVEDLQWGAASENVDSSSAEAYVAQIEERIGAGEVLLIVLAGRAGTLEVGGLSAGELARMRTTVTDRLAGLQQQREEWSDRAAALAEQEAEAKREAQERKAAEKAKREAEEKAKQEAEAKAKREAQEKAEREAEAKAAAERQAELEAEARRQREAEANRRPANPAPAPAPASPPSSGTGRGTPGAGYTGCRAYIGGPYIDDKGRRYTPIDCQTKLPLVP